MMRWIIGLAGSASILSALVVACSSSSSPSQGTESDGGGSSGSSSGVHTSPVSEDAAAGGFDAGPDAPVATTTIAAARQAFLDAGSVPAITVNAIVTAVQGPTGDQVNWYVEDPAGGPYSGIIVYCDPLAAKACPCKAGCTPHVAAPPIGTLVSIRGTVTAYKGQLQLEPTAQTILENGATPPPTFVASASDLAETGNSPYRGVYVKFPSTVTVDDVTPAALYDSQCSTDGGTPLCSGCAPPTYAGSRSTARAPARSSSRRRSSLS